MKWDVKHDRAKKVLNHFLDNAGYWTETESLTEGLTEDEIQEVSAEVATMIQSITKRYKLDVMLPAEPVVKEEPVVEEKVEEPVVEEPAEEVKEEKPDDKNGNEPPLPTIPVDEPAAQNVTEQKTESVPTAQEPELNLNITKHNV